MLMMTRFKPLLALLGVVLYLPAPAQAHMPMDSVAAPGTTPGPDSEPRFLRRYIDLDYGGNGKPGWVRAGDIDLDGDRDLVAGGGYALFVYENGGEADGWQRYGNLDATNQMGANGAELYDVDGDGDLDVVSALYYGNLGWWENPDPPLTGAPWVFHVLSNETRYMHDLIRVDLDGDQVAEEFIANLNSGYWSASITIKWFRPGVNPNSLWEQHTIEADRSEGAPHGHAGLDLADLDDDGDFDLAYANGWYEGPANPAGTWTWHQVTTEYGVSNVLARDMDEDDDLDLVMGAGHHGEGVYWYEQPDGSPFGVWAEHEIDALLHHPECLQSVDLAADGDVDIVTCDLFFGEASGEPGWDEEVHSIYLFENLPGDDSWQESVLSPNSYPSHQLRIDDVNQDGMWDVISESAGTSVVSYYENAMATSYFNLEVVDSAYSGNGRPGWSAAGDLDGDGLVDVVAGGGGAIQWYRAPEWTRFPLEASSSAGGNGGLVVDVDRDGALDVVAALYNSSLVWWRNPGTASVTGTWVRYTIDGFISHFNHDLVIGDLDGDDEGELVALYVGGGVYWYDVPVDPLTDAWPRTRILASVSDPYVGLAVGDLDADLDLDVVVSNRWFEQPATPTTADWTGRQLFTDAVQNVACFDVNGDGRPDVVGAEGFVYPDGRVLWVEAPINPKTQSWAEHVVAEHLDGPENLWAGDLDGDGLTDIVSGEMGTSTGFDDSDSNLFALFGRNADGTLWERRDLSWSVGVSARIRPTDVDADGDLDFVADGNAEDHIYLWRQEGAAVLFSDGFEAGDASAWTSSTP
ncbi:MAG: VCBS repeat-containing protein [Thermoanaerobaculia bacterium]